MRHSSLIKRSDLGRPSPDVQPARPPDETVASFPADVLNAHSRRRRRRRASSEARRGGPESRKSSRRGWALLHRRRRTLYGRRSVGGRGVSASVPATVLQAAKWPNRRVESSPVRTDELTGGRRVERNRGNGALVGGSVEVVLPTESRPEVVSEGEVGAVGSATCSGSACLSGFACVCLAACPSNVLIRRMVTAAV